MFLLPSLAVGLLLALILGGKPARLLEVRFRLAPLVPIALGVQLVLFTPLGSGLPTAARETLHLGTYALMLAFGAANLRLRPFVPIVIGTALNAVAITANGGGMPVSSVALRAAGIVSGTGSNLSPHGHSLRLLGDVFALPSALPLANVFSGGDVLIALGAIALLVTVSLEPSPDRLLSAGRMTRPLATRGFRTLLLGKLVSEVGDWLTTAVLVGWLYNESRSTAQVALLILARLVPPILGSSVAAIVVDRVSKRRVLVFVELARAVFVAGALAAVATGEHKLVFVAVAASGGLAALSNAAMPTLVPVLLPVTQYESANAALGLAENLAMAFGAACAGLALTSFGVVPALAVDIATFAVAAAFFTRLPRLAMQPSRQRSVGLLAGVRHLAAKRGVLVLLGAFAAATAATGLANATLPRFAEEGLGLGPGGYCFGFAALAVGLALGEGSMGFVSVGDSAGRWIGGGLALMAGLFTLLALTQHVPTALLLLAAIGFVDGTTDIAFDTAVQRETDQQFHGAVFGVASAAFRTTMTAAVIIAPLANDLVPAGRVLLFTGFLLAFAAAITWLGGERSDRALRAEPTPQPAHSARNG